MPTKVKFKIKRWNDGMPNGYRLATVEEARNNLDTLRRRALLKDSKIEAARLLDGRIFPDYRPEHVFDSLIWFVAVKEKERDEDAGVWKKKCSACYPSNGNLLRKQVYDGITLSQQGRHTAMALASINGDAEVLYWLLKTTNQTEAQRFRDLLHKSSKIQKYQWGFTGISAHVFETLSASQFPLQLPLESHHFSYSLEKNGFWYYGLERWTTFDILRVELCVEMYSADIVHGEVRDGMSILDIVTEEVMSDKRFIPALTKLMSYVSDQHSLENQVSKMKNEFGDIFTEATERGYAQLVENLLKLKDYVKQLPTNACMKIATGAVRKGYLQCLSEFLNLLKEKAGNELQQDKHGKTLFHYAADSGNKSVFQLLIETYEDVYRLNKRDKLGRNILHWAALNGQADFCKMYASDWHLKVDAKDSFGRNSLHFAAQGKMGHLVVDYLVESSSVDLIYEKDDEGRTPLHLASAKGNIKMVEKLLSFDADKVKHYVQQADGFRKTALQMAARGGHTRIVRLLLDEGSDPLSERDVNGGTALHCATQVEDAEVAGAISRSLLNKYGNDEKTKSLLLWALAAGIGTAEETEEVHHFVEDFLLREKSRNETNLLQAAAVTKNAEMAWELLNRGARFTDLEKYIAERYRSNEEIENVKSVIKEIEIAKEHGRDKPSLEDNLERNVLAEGLAALFLNKFIESPITVGISGEWGMGKSSLMIQTENMLLMAASQLTFPNLLYSEKFVGAEKISLSARGRKIYARMKVAMNKLFAHSEYRPWRNVPFFCLLPYAVYVGVSKLYRLLTSSESERGLVSLLEQYHPNTKQFISPLHAWMFITKW